MAYDIPLAERLLDAVVDVSGVTHRKMFGGFAVMVNGHMLCGVIGDQLMARVGADAYEACLALPYASPMDFTGKALKGLVYVAPDGVDDEEDLETWVQRCLAFVLTLPPKAPKKRKGS